MFEVTVQRDLNRDFCIKLVHGLFRKTKLFILFCSFTDVRFGSAPPPVSITHY